MNVAALEVGARVASLDQHLAAAEDMGKIVARFWNTLRNDGLPEEAASGLAYDYMEAQIALIQVDRREKD